MAKLFDISKALNAAESNGTGETFRGLIEELHEAILQPDPAGGWSRPMRDDETIREYVEATLPSDEHVRQTCQFLDLTYEREEIIKDRCWTVFQMRQRERERMLERDERRVR